MSRISRSAIWITALAVVAIVIIVVGGISIATYTLAQIHNHGRRRSCKFILKQMETTMEEYRRDHGVYPPGIDSLNDGKNPKGAIYFSYTVNGESRPIRDPWGRPFAYRNPGSGGSSHPGFRPKLGVEFYSVGPNGIDEGGKGDDVTAGD